MSKTKERLCNSSSVHDFISFFWSLAEVKKKKKVGLVCFQWARQSRNFNNVISFIPHVTAAMEAALKSHFTQKSLHLTILELLGVQLKSYSDSFLLAWRVTRLGTTSASILPADVALPRLRSFHEQQHLVS